MTAPRLSIAVLALAGLAVAGCGSNNNDNGGGSSKPSAAPPATSGGGSTVKLSETEFKIDPADPSVKKAGTVTFNVSNDGQTTHALEVEGPGEEKKTSDIA